MEKDSQYVWFGTDRGLLRYDKKKNRWRTYDSFKGLWHNDVTALKSDEGSLWIGTGWGLNFYLPKKDSLIRIKDELLKGAYIYSIEKDSNFIWIGTDEGAFQLNKKSGEVIPFNIPEGVLNQEVKSIYKYQDELWFGTRDAVVGIDLISRKRMIYQSPVNYPGTEVTKLVCDEKFVWVGTILGVWRLDKQKNIWKGYFKEDGLLDNNIQTLLLDGDYIWFGTERGATRFYWNNPLRID
jgi:ligand-binding sensor domain-containing protein